MLIRALGHDWEECSGDEWDKENELSREIFLRPGGGLIFAKHAKQLDGIVAGKPKFLHAYYGLKS